MNIWEHLHVQHRSEIKEDRHTIRWKHVQTDNRWYFSILPSGDVYKKDEVIVHINLKKSVCIYFDLAISGFIHVSLQCTFRLSVFFKLLVVMWYRNTLFYWDDNYLFCVLFNSKCKSIFSCIIIATTCISPERYIMFWWGICFKTNRFLPWIWNWNKFDDRN